MPGRPNPKSKTPQIIVRCRPEWETEFRAMKEICARNGLKLNEEVYERAVKPFLRDHNWPPGNSQTLLERFGLELSLICFRCHKKFKHLRRVEYISGKIAYSCEECLRKDRLRRVVKNDRLGII